MRVVVDINHPAHVHFFKNFIWEMRRKGHDLHIVASEKDVALQLLKHYSFKYNNIGSYGNTNLKKLLNIPVLDYRMYKSVKGFNPDIFVGLGSVRASHISKLMGKPCIIFEDTEHSTEQYVLYAPFTDVILTPSSFKKNLGKKQIRYDGCHELAYLHPRYFRPNPEVLSQYGLNKSDNIFLIRFAAFDASHHRKSNKLRKEYIWEIISRLEKVGTVIVSSEMELDHIYSRYRYRLTPDKYHDMLYYSRMYIGEGSTTAEESAILGVPALHFERICINGRFHDMTYVYGLLDEMQNRYGLLYGFCEENTLIKKIDELIPNLEQISSEWKVKRNNFLNDKIDVTKFLIWFIEEYPYSCVAMKENPQIQCKFKQVYTINE